MISRLHLPIIISWLTYASSIEGLIAYVERLKRDVTWITVMHKSSNYTFGHLNGALQGNVRCPGSLTSLPKRSVYQRGCGVPKEGSPTSADECVTDDHSTLGHNKLSKCSIAKICWSILTCEYERTIILALVHAAAYAASWLANDFLPMK